MKRIVAFILSAILLNACSPTQTHEVWLDELDLSLADQSAGIARANQSMWRTPLVIAGDTFLRGVGTHADGVLRIRLDGKTERFSAKAGIDASAPRHELEKATAEFIVIGDGKELWRSGVMTAQDKATEISLDTHGIRSLILQVSAAGDGITGDRADWVDARFAVAGKDPVTAYRDREAEYILTPKPDKAPRINAPYLYGATPGAPFRFIVPVSGERPIRITADKLPEGLTLDETTGIITGTAPDRGDYTINITAANRYGTDNNRLTIKVGDRIALTPPMGWNSWNVFGEDIDEQKIKEIADAMVALHLPDYGYAYINIDDGWQGKRGGKYNAIQCNEKFPDMKALVDYVHDKGLKIGIYSSPWVQTFAGFVGGSADTPDGQVIDSSRRTGKYDFSANDVKQWAEWGFDYLKYDWVTNDVENTTVMNRLLRDSGRDIVFSISNAAPFELADRWMELTNTWRTTGDIVDTWCSMTNIGFMQNRWQPFAGNGHWNDPDMLVVGKVGWGDDIHTTRLSPDEQYTHITLWSVLAAPLLAGCDLRLMDDFTLSLLCNREVIAVDQDPAGIQGQRIKVDGSNSTEVWARPLHDGSVAVALFNRSEIRQKITVSWEELGIEGRQSVRDLWRQKDLKPQNKKFSADVPSHGTVFIRLTPVS